MQVRVWKTRWVLLVLNQAQIAKAGRILNSWPCLTHPPQISETNTLFLKGLCTTYLFWYKGQEVRYKPSRRKLSYVVSHFLCNTVSDVDANNSLTITTFLINYPATILPGTNKVLRNLLVSILNFTNIELQVHFHFC